MKLSLFEILIIGAVLVGIGGVIFIWKTRQSSSSATSEQTIQFLTPTLNNPTIYSYHPPPGSPGSDISYLYGTNAYGYTNEGYSPYNIYKIPTGLVQANPPGTGTLTGTGLPAYLYAGNRIPDMLLSPSQIANLQQTRIGQSMWPVSKYGDPILGGDNVSIFG